MHIQDFMNMMYFFLMKISITYIKKNAYTVLCTDIYMWLNLRIKNQYFKKKKNLYI